MSDEIRVDIDSLKEHVDIIRSEYRLACEITEKILAAKQLDDMTFHFPYSRLYNYSKAIEEHFANMIVTVENMANSFVHLNNSIKLILEDGLENVQS